MALWQIFLGVAVVVVVAIGAEAWLKRNRPRRPLAEKMHDPDGVETEPQQLGMEATNLSIMDEAIRANNRSSMTSDSHMTLRKNPFATFRAKRPRPMPDDESYSKLFYDAFQKPRKDAPFTQETKK